jgi:hypothetical protein
MKSTSDGISHIQMQLPEVTPQTSPAHGWTALWFADAEGADAPQQQVQSGARH